MLFLQICFTGKQLKNIAIIWALQKILYLALEKFLEHNHFQIPLLVIKRGARGLDERLSWHYIDQNMTKHYFSNFCQNKFPGLTKKSTALPSIRDRVQCKKHLALKNQFFQLFQTFSKKKPDQSFQNKNSGCN